MNGVASESLIVPGEDNEILREKLPGARRIGHNLLLWMGMALLSTGCYFLISCFCVSAVIVEGRSMEPTLQNGEQLLLDRLSPHWRKPQRGDLVVLQDPGHKDFAVKRIVAIPGERVQFFDERVYINGQLLEEPYLAPHTSTQPLRQVAPAVLASDEYFVLGDNRRHSEDSRIYGPIRRDQIRGFLLN